MMNRHGLRLTAGTRGLHGEAFSKRWFSTFLLFFLYIESKHKISHAGWDVHSSTSDNFRGFSSLRLALADQSSSRASISIYLLSISRSAHMRSQKKKGGRLQITIGVVMVGAIYQNQRTGKRMVNPRQWTTVVQLHLAPSRIGRQLKKTHPMRHREWCLQHSSPTILTQLAFKLHSTNRA
jgi:hypothetical protein